MVKRNEFDISEINRRTQEYDQLKEKIEYNQAKERIFNSVGKPDDEDIRLVNTFDYKREEKEKLDHRVFLMILIGIPIVGIAYATGLVDWLVIIGVVGVSILSIIANK